jgi:hypothetical protein
MPIRDVLPQRRNANADPSSPTTAVPTRDSEAAAYFTGKMVSIAIAMAFVLAIAAGACLQANLSIDTLAGLGFGLMVWSIATIAIVVIGVYLAL